MKIMKLMYLKQEAKRLSGDDPVDGYQNLCYLIEDLIDTIIEDAELWIDDGK